MYKVEVIKNGKIIRTRHFITRKKAEAYENEQYKYNWMSALCTFKITEA